MRTQRAWQASGTGTGMMARRSLDQGSALAAQRRALSVPPKHRTRRRTSVTTQQAAQQQEQEQRPDANC